MKAWGTLLARVILGLIFFMAGWWKVFVLGPLQHAEKFFLPFSDTFLKAYLDASGKALLSCVGAYRLEGLGIQLFSHIDGDYFAILGLPLLPLITWLREQGALMS